MNSLNNDQSASENSEQDFFIKSPSVSLPKGGGAVNGIGEKFTANPVTGTGSFSVPITTSSGRSGFGPQLSLSYDSGAGNSIFGFGWNLSLPTITRKTDKGLPRYLSGDDSDVFILSGAEDLIPELQTDNSTHTNSQNKQWRKKSTTRIVDRQTYQISSYRPRIEGLFARIEYWINTKNAADCFWRSISKENITTWYGKTEQSRIADPENPKRIYSWLICQSYDAKGNVIDYEYKVENSDSIDLFRSHEQHRKAINRSANRYIKRIKYANHQPFFPILEPDEAVNKPTKHWFLEVVFDYGEHHKEQPMPNEDVLWKKRSDPFSSYRSGFEVRTQRLCQRILMFHHFEGSDISEGEEGGLNYCVRSTDIQYKNELANNTPNSAQSFSQIHSVNHISYRKKSDGEYQKRTTPPVEFNYSQPKIGNRIKIIEADNLENLPQGVDGNQYRWVDLDGEGLTGVLTEQAGCWFYKSNESAITRKAAVLELEPESTDIETDETINNDITDAYNVRLAPAQQVINTPSFALAGGARQLMDLSGNGKLDLVQFAPPMSGFFQRNVEDKNSWDNFYPFQQQPNINWQDPNLKFIDLTGDGHADAVITEADVITWYPSLAEKGFTKPNNHFTGSNEDEGPRILFSDSEQSIFQSDFSGDGLADIVRIRNGEVCYWPNLGYGKFGKKITMDNAPLFDVDDQFSSQRLRLADIDGSGVVDIIYLGRQESHIWFNQSGNSWSEAHVIQGFPQVDNLASVNVVDLLGNGTACLVWSSPLPNDQTTQMRYIELMAEGKPHLLTHSKNNMGAETSIHYVPSTYFYLKDKQAGKPWITRLPFPVHVVEQVVATDKWRKTRFASSYSYHHGYFDGREREFRGFGRVEQIDIESFGTLNSFNQANANSPYISDDETLYQPPIKTITWYHTGASLERDKILSQYRDEYFSNNLDHISLNLDGTFQENHFPEANLSQLNLSSDEWHEAMRACKGLMLRQEVYELDVKALENAQHKPVKLFSAAYHNCHIQKLQPKNYFDEMASIENQNLEKKNQHAVFLVTESEAITYHYELNLVGENIQPDPRIAHTLNINIDEYGNVLQSIAAVYPRVIDFEDELLSLKTNQLIQQVQNEQHLTYTEIRLTNDVVDSLDHYHLRLPCEVKNYELTGIKPLIENNHYFTLAQLQAFQLNEKYQFVGTLVEPLDYHKIANRLSPQKRLVEWLRTLYFNEDLVNPLPFAELNALALSYETYKLALTDELLESILGDKLTPSILIDLQTLSKSGYLSGTELTERFSDLEEPVNSLYWIASGIAGFANDAKQHFYLPERYTDVFGNVVTLEFDERDLFVKSSTDPLGNTTKIKKFNYRVLAPLQTEDINKNSSEVVFDTLGVPAAAAIKGKANQADHLNDFNNDELLDLALEQRIDFFVGDYTTDKASQFLAGASTRHIYDFGEQIDADGHVIAYAQRPASSASITREKHVVDLNSDEQTPLQIAFQYSDASGNVIVTKSQAEPEEGELNETELDRPLRWIASGKTIVNNKGKPVKQYEPYFSEQEDDTGTLIPNHRFEEPKEVGVTPIIYYDSAGRVIRTELPDGNVSYVEFNSWTVVSFDPNDTAYNEELSQQSDWYRRRMDPTHEKFSDYNSPENQRAARLTQVHANTPSRVFLDSLGRDVISIAHNRVTDTTGSMVDEHHITFTKLDAEGKPLWIRDARNNLVMQYITPLKPTMASAEPNQNDIEVMPTNSMPCYDIAGNLLYQYSMDADSRWLINDATGQPFYAWNLNSKTNNESTSEDSTEVLEQRIARTKYDVLRRPLENQLQINGGTWQTIERIIYGESLENLTNTQENNLRGQVYQHYDASGVITSEAFDFKGNLLRATRQLSSEVQTEVIHWPSSVITTLPINQLEQEVFAQNTQYDALNRMVRQENWHRLNQTGQPDRPPATYLPQYNERGVLKSERLLVNNEETQAIRNIIYDAKGQRQVLALSNNTFTRYEYDQENFRLIHLITQSNDLTRTYQNLHYTYDPVGNITDIRDDAQQTLFFRNTRVDPHCKYQYDALYRLIKAQGREHAAQNNNQRDNTALVATTDMPFPNSPEALQNYTQIYQYDAVGNILNMRHSGGGSVRWNRFYQYAQNSNRLLATSKPGDNRSNVDHYAEMPASQLSQHYDYDIHGSMLAMDRSIDELKLHWDYRDMIHHLNLDASGQSQAWYNYDSQKQRTRKHITKNNGSIIEERFYLGGMELYRRSVNGTLVEEIETHHLFATDDRVLIVENVIETNSSSLDAGILFRYQYSNHLGSVGLELNQVEDQNPEVISYEEYHPYGTTAYSAKNKDVKAVGKRYRYTGMERDEETGLSYHMARYYLPWLGRWGSSDPIGVGGGINVYSYSASNPIVLSDSSGTQPETEYTFDEDIVYGSPSEYNFSHEEAGIDLLFSFSDSQGSYVEGSPTIIIPLEEVRIISNLEILAEHNFDNENFINTIRLDMSQLNSNAALVIDTVIQEQSEGIQNFINESAETDRNIMTVLNLLTAGIARIAPSDVKPSFQTFEDVYMTSLTNSHEENRSDSRLSPEWFESFAETLKNTIETRLVDALINDSSFHNNILSAARGFYISGVLENRFLSNSNAADETNNFIHELILGVAPNQENSGRNIRDNIAPSVNNWVNSILQPIRSEINRRRRLVIPLAFPFDTRMVDPFTVQGT